MKNKTQCIFSLAMALVMAFAVNDQADAALVDAASKYGPVYAISDVNKDGVKDLAQGIFRSRYEPDDPVTYPWNGLAFTNPSVVIFSGKTGKILRKIDFFDDKCPYWTMALNKDAGAITMVIVPQVGLDLGPGGFGETPGPDFFPECTYLQGTAKTLAETRKLKNGGLIRQIELEDIPVSP